MRIDALNQVSRMYQPTRTKTVAKSSAAGSGDNVEISRAAQDYQLAKKAVGEAPDIREEKVKDIKEQLASGSYNVSAVEIADKMVSKYFDTII